MKQPGNKLDPDGLDGVNVTGETQDQATKELSSGRVLTDFLIIYNNKN